MHCGRCRSKSLELDMIRTPTTARPSHSSPFATSQFTADVAFPLSLYLSEADVVEWHRIDTLMSESEGAKGGALCQSYLCAASRNWDLMDRNCVSWRSLCTMHKWHPTQISVFELFYVHHWFNQWWAAGLQHFQVNWSFHSEESMGYLLIQCRLSLCCNWIRPLLD